MGAGASAKHTQETEGTKAPRMPNVEARKIQLLLAAIGKTAYLEAVLGAITTANNGAALADDAAALAALDTACNSVAEMPDADKVYVKEFVGKRLKGRTNIIGDDLAYYASQAICKHNTASKARAKFDELDVDKSGSLDGTELNKVVQWMFTMTADGPVSTEEEEEAKQMMLERIDTSKNQKLSFDEFLVLFEEEQRKGMMMKYAKQKFAELDANKSGNLDNQELNKLVNWLLDLTEEDFSDDDKELIKVELMARVGDVQSDGSTVVSYDNFVLLCEEEMERVELRRRAKDKFMELDKNNTGVLEKDELYKVVDFMYHSLGCGNAKNKEAAKADMMQRVDANGDGKLDVTEFITLFEQVYIESNRPLEAIAAVE